MNKLLIAILWLKLATAAHAVNLAVSSDADYYLFYGTYNSTRTPLFVGVNDQQSGSPYQYHFNTVGIELNDLTGVNIGDTSLLKLNLQRFRVPGTVVPGYQGPPTYSYLTSGVTFTIKAVALTDSFSNIEYASNPLDWFNNNLLNRPALDTVTFNQAGEVTFNITQAINQWKIDPLTNFGVGLIGTYSSVTGSTAQFYSSEYMDPVFRPTVSVIPEPSTIEFIAATLGIIFITWFLTRR